jgi:hypothetical protein
VKSLVRGFHIFTVFLCLRHKLNNHADIDSVAAALSSAFGGLIAFAILYMDGTAGKQGWQW